MFVYGLGLGIFAPRFLPVRLTTTVSMLSNPYSYTFCFLKRLFTLKNSEKKVNKDNKKLETMKKIKNCEENK
jgi:hypothetical protein